MQLPSRSECCGRADIAQEHVGFLHFVQQRLEGAGDCFFHETLSQTDAQVSRENLNYVLSFTP